MDRLLELDESRQGRIGRSEVGISGGVSHGQAQHGLDIASWEPVKALKISS